MGIESKYIWMDGKLVEFEKATVHFLSPSLHYGVGVFEGIRAYSTDKGTAVFRLREHMERLVDSAMILGFRSMPYSVDELVDAVKLTVRENGFKECYIRPLVYCDATTMGLNLDATAAKIGIAVWDMGSYLGVEALEKGVRANVSSFTRHHPNVTMTKAKTAGNYANSIMAKTESVRLGFEEAIMLDPQGYVAECTGENLFLVRNGKIITTQTAAVLEGITRDALLTIMHDKGYEVVEQLVSRDQLYIADEMFVCGTAAEVTPVSEVDFRKVGAGKRGPVTADIQKAFNEAIHGKNPKYIGWLDFV
jgi:branched-chain amino acid aminotransferase